MQSLMKTSNIRPIALVLIRHADRVLVSMGRDDVKGTSFCRPLGGGIEFGERSVEAARREIREEVGASLVNEKLLSVIENVFEYNGAPGHELLFLYSGEIVEGDILAKERIEILDKPGTFAQWVPASDIKNGTVMMYPEGVAAFL